jgi:hypothetical protein
LFAASLHVATVFGSFGAVRRGGIIQPGRHSAAAPAPIAAGRPAATVAGTVATTASFGTRSTVAAIVLATCLPLPTAGFPLFATFLALGNFLVEMFASFRGTKFKVCVKSAFVSALKRVGH